MATKRRRRGSFRFQRRLKILPGISLNFSRSGISTSIGGRGAHVTIGKRSVRRTIGIPGTGISYSTTTPRKAALRGGLRLKHLLLAWLAAFVYAAIELQSNQAATSVLVWSLIGILSAWPIYRLVSTSRRKRSSQEGG